jgi:ankyrin repeat protein
MQALPRQSDSISRRLPGQEKIKDPPITCVFGMGIVPDVVDSLKNNWIAHQLKIKTIGTGNEKLEPKRLIEKIARRLINGSHLMLYVHGASSHKTNNNKHHLLINSSPEGVLGTVEFFEQLFSYAKKLNPTQARTHLPLSVVHILSCYSGELSKDLLPDNPLWQSAYFIVYSSKKFTCPNHYGAAMDAAASYISGCVQRGEAVNPSRLFFLASSRSGDCMRMLGGHLQAPLIVHAPKLAADLQEERLAHRLEAGLRDKADFYLSAIDTVRQKRDLTTPVSGAIAELLQTRIGRRDLHSVEQLLKDCSDLIDQPSSTGVLSLNVAILEGFEPIIDLFLRSGANLWHTDGVGVGPILSALMAENNELLSKLLTQGANSNETDVCGNSALLSAVMQGSKVAAALLLEHGANMNYSDNGNTVLSLAVKKGDANMVELLLKNGAGRDAGLSSELASTAIHNNHIAIAELLYRALLSLPRA